SGRTVASARARWRSEEWSRRRSTVPWDSFPWRELRDRGSRVRPPSSNGTLYTRCRFRASRMTNCWSASMTDHFLRSLTRREALGLLGMSAAAAALPDRAFGQTPVFPKGAVIRTLLKDYAPEELAGGATLFHEHMQLAV